jgi:hypothetical protein
MGLWQLADTLSLDDFEVGDGVYHQRKYSGESSQNTREEYAYILNLTCYY